MDLYWQDRRVFITGGTGLIGGYLIQKLITLGADLVILVRDHVPQSLLNQKFLPYVTVVHGDLSQSSKLERILCEYEIQTVFHLAAQTIVPIANKNPLSTFESNIQGTWNVLEACRLVKSVQSIIIASSDKAYGDSDTLPYTEDLPLKALYPYDVSKACADLLAKSYASTFQMPVAITRCGNFFGGGDLNWNRLIPGTIRSILRQMPPIIRSNGQLIRDYIYVEDAVDAYMTLSKALSLNPMLRGEAFNFSNATQKTTLDLVYMILSLMDSNLTPQIKGNNTGEILAQYLDSSKAASMLGWNAAHGLENGLIKTIEWYQHYFKITQKPHFYKERYNEYMSPVSRPFA
ncbi:MAG: CDP-glucose 4,6-dehydratase [Holosporales bacterium]